MRSRHGAVVAALLGLALFAPVAGGEQAFRTEKDLVWLDVGGEPAEETARKIVSHLPA